MFHRITTLLHWHAVAQANTRMRLSVEPLEGRAGPANFAAANAAELIAAIDASNLTPNADKITLVAGAIYPLTVVNTTTHGPKGLPAIAGNLVAN
jgi:hypothetical protein